jgi:hypothetical protein
MSHYPESGSHRRDADELSNFVAWRWRCLVAAGLSEPDAIELARDPEADLHCLLDLVDRGCPPALAVRIMTPLNSVRGSPP